LGYLASFGNGLTQSIHLPCELIQVGNGSNACTNKNKHKLHEFTQTTALMAVGNKGKVGWQNRHV